MLLQFIFWRCFPDTSTSLRAATGQVHEVPVLFEAVKHTLVAGGSEVLLFQLLQ